jgi:hypothetical protein
MTDLEMNERYSDRRPAAAAALTKLTRTPPLQTRAQDELDSAAHERQARTALLREQRLARERFDSQAGS